jgi:hypothetical protein
MSVGVGAIVLHGILLESSNSLAIDTQCNTTTKGIQAAVGACNPSQPPSQLKRRIITISECCAELLANTRLPTPTFEAALNCGILSE